MQISTFSPKKNYETKIMNGKLTKIIGSALVPYIHERSSKLENFLISEIPEKKVSKNRNFSTKNRNLKKISKSLKKSKDSLTSEIHEKIPKFVKKSKSQKFLENRYISKKNSIFFPVFKYYLKYETSRCAPKKLPCAIVKWQTNRKRLKIDIKLFFLSVVIFFRFL